MNIIIYNKYKSQGLGNNTVIYNGSLEYDVDVLFRSVWTVNHFEDTQRCRNATITILCPIRLDINKHSATPIDKMFVNKMSANNTTIGDC